MANPKPEQMIWNTKKKETSIVKIRKKKNCKRMFHGSRGRTSITLHYYPTLTYFPALEKSMEPRDIHKDGQTDLFKSYQLILYRFYYLYGIIYIYMGSCAKINAGEKLIS